MPSFDYPNRSHIIDLPLQIETNNGILIITLNRPKANAINVDTSHYLYECFKQFQNDSALRVAIITGAGKKFFSAGWDLNGAVNGEAIDADHGPGGFAGLTEFFALTKPVIAAVNGYAVGGGFELALAADLIIAADHAEFGLPEVTIGMIPDAGGILRLPKKLPRVIANELLFTGRRIKAQEALQWGLVNKVVPLDQLMPTAMALAKQICKTAPLATVAAKEVLAHTEHLSVEDGYQKIRSSTLPHYMKMLKSEDAEEGPKAFTEKREPVWKNK